MLALHLHRWLPAALLSIGAGALGAQTPPADSAAPRTPLVSRHALETFGGFVVAGAALYPLDARLEHAFRSPGLQGNGAARDAAKAFNFAGDPGALAAGVVLLGVGRLTGHTATARSGLHATEAIVLGGSATAAIKLLAGRQRPFVQTGDHDDFAFASAVSSDVRASRWRVAHPRAAAVVTPLLYGGATLVGAARMYDDKHWASDVALGAGVGTLAGHIVSAYARAHPHGWLERLAGGR